MKNTIKTETKTYWVENEIPKASDKNIIEYIVPCIYKESDILNFTVGISKIPHWNFNKRTDKQKWYTFLKEGKEYYGNAHKYRNIEDLLHWIKDNIKYAIRMEKSFIPKLKIDGQEINLFTRIGCY